MSSTGPEPTPLQHHDTRRVMVLESQAAAPPWRSLTWIAAALLGLAALASLYLARGFLLPVALALLLTAFLRPVVVTLTRLHVPRSLAAALVVLTTLFVLIAAMAYLAGPAAVWLEKAPRALPRIEEKLSALKKPLEKLTLATDQVARLAEVGAHEIPSVELRKGRTAVLEFVGATQSIAFDALVTLILLFFLLASGDFFLRQAILLLPKAHHALGQQCSSAIKKQISVYLGTVTTINFCLGSGISFVLWLLGVPNPVLWGVMQGALTFIPYLGPVVGIGVIAAVALISIEDLVLAAMAPLLCAALSAIEGHIVTPVILGKSLALNPVAIFVALMFWTWMWGILGAIMAVPILMATKITCENIGSLHAVARLLGNYEVSPQRTRA